MKSERIELRADSEFRRKLDDLARDMQCSASSVVRRLVIAECKRRLPAVTKPPQGTSITLVASAVPPPPMAANTSVAQVITPQSHVSLVNGDPDAATRMLLELGVSAEELGLIG